MNWKETAKRSIIGDKTILKSIKPAEETLKQWKEEDLKWENYWIKPKKFSIAGKDKVDRVTISNTKVLPAKLKLAISKLYRENPDLKSEDMIEHLGEEEQLLLFESQADNFNNEDMIKAILTEGLAETNLVSKDESLEQFIEEVVEYNNIATEIMEIIRDFNVPLAKEKPKT